MPLDERAKDLRVGLARHRLQQHGLAVDLARKLAVGVVDVPDAVGHTGAEVGAGRAKDDDPTAGHVLAAMVANTLDDGGGAAIADTEALPGTTGGKQAAPSGAIENR